MVSQNDTPPFDLRVDEYVLLGRAPHLGLLTIPGDTDRIASAAALSTVGMTHMAGHAVTRLSSGEKQLVNMARSLAQEPEILLLDEPCSHLDLINSRQMLVLMETIAKQGRTVVFTTHDPNAAAAVADQVLLMRKRGTGGSRHSDTDPDPSVAHPDLWGRCGSDFHGKRTVCQGCIKK